MRAQLIEALDHGALGLSSGLAYFRPLGAGGGNLVACRTARCRRRDLRLAYATEGEEILSAMSETFDTGRHCHVPVVISHLKCAGIANWGRSGEILHALDDGAGRAAGAVRLLSLCGLAPAPSIFARWMTACASYHLVDAAS